MAQKQQSKANNPKEKYIIIATIIIITVILGWAGLTKVGAIPNFMDVEILCPGDEDNGHIENYTQPYSNRLDGDMMPKKPVIYLYPQSTQDISVKLDYQGSFIATYPAYNDAIKGWNVTASPDGSLINKADGLSYSYLFWEGKSNSKINWDMSKGFVVKGSDTIAFLQAKLATLGLTPKEYNEFIVYWYPLMKDNPYNLISFAGKQYTDTAKLDITPKPDSMLRVFMVYKALDKSINIESQKLQSFTRTGFTVVEWGGSEVK